MSCKPRQKQPESLLLIEFWSLFYDSHKEQTEFDLQKGCSLSRFRFTALFLTQALRVKLRESDIN